MLNLYKQEERIENYLESVRCQLNKMSEAERDAEIAEVHSHLLSLTQAHIELGASEQAALQAALQQFGNPQSVGTDLLRAWQQGRKRKLPGTVLSATAWAFALTLLMNRITVLMVLSNVGKELHATMPNLMFGLQLLMGCSQTLFTGYMTGRRAPRRAFTGIVLSSGLFVSYSVVMFYRNVPDRQRHMYMIYIGMFMAISLAVQCLGVWLGRKQFLSRQDRKPVSA